MKKVDTKKDGKMIIFTAPSGAGKTTVVQHLLKEFSKQLAFSVSATTRSKRTHEVEGRDYYFLSQKEFQKKINLEEFVEWEEVYHGQYYGTLKSEIERLWQQDKVIIFDVDVVGATDIKKEYGERCLSIFIQTPSLNVHVDRLRSRKTETEESLKKRIDKIKYEMGFKEKFDTVLINDLLEVTLNEAELLVKQFTGINSEEIIANSKQKNK